MTEQRAQLAVFLANLGEILEAALERRSWKHVRDAQKLARQASEGLVDELAAGDDDLEDDDGDVPAAVVDVPAAG